LKFIKQNFLTLIVLIILLVNFNKLNDLLVKYNDLNSRYFMLENSILNLPNNSGFIPPQSPPNDAKDVMSPLELAKYMGIEMNQVYDMVEKDSTIPFIQINGEYRFNKAAIEKWMETRKIIETE
jgi:excisionase family DNA binding protein